MKIENIKDECTGCTACKTVCPVQCISMQLDEEGFYSPQIDKTKCVQCGKCESVCHCLHHDKVNINKSSYFGWHKDENKRFASSSGGAFIAFAEEIIRRDGVVFGAAFDAKQRKLHHISSEKVALESLQKSKYIESDLENCFEEILSCLKADKWVLFCGTPCQVSGLRSIVKNISDKLITIDFICHGVPSSVFFREHLSCIISPKEELLDVDFRPKRISWSRKNIALRTRTRTRTRTRSYLTDSYYYGFMKENVFLRRSCYNCKYRQNHFSNITIADFWGYRLLDTSLNNEKGLSLLVANNEKGKQFVDNIAAVFELHTIDNKYSDYAYEKKDYSVAWSKRDAFFELVKKYGFEGAANRTYMKGASKRYIIYKIKYVIKKIIGRK